MLENLLFLIELWNCVKPSVKSTLFLDYLYHFYGNTHYGLYFNQSL